MATVVTEHTPKLLRNGKPPHPLTDEQRAAGRAKALANKQAAAEKYRMERLVPKSYKVFDIALSNAIRAREVDARALDTAKFAWEHVHGKATQRVETTEVPAGSLYEQLTPEARRLYVAQIQARMAELDALEPKALEQGDIPP